MADVDARARDLGSESETRPPKPCCARMRRDWCALPDGHAGPHLSWVLAKRFAPYLAIAAEAVK